MHGGGFIDTPFLIEVVAALVHEVGIDPQWLLTGEYDPAVHRQALFLGEDRDEAGAYAVRKFVEEQYRQLRNRKRFWGSFLSLRPSKSSSSRAAR